MWFQSVFGTLETEFYSRNQTLFQYDPDKMTLLSRANSVLFDVGPFEILSCADLDNRIASSGDTREETDRLEDDRISSRLAENGVKLTFENIIGDVRTYIRDPFNNGCVFQVASQFNCLEMVGPKVSPEAGISIYSKDPTQGPACAIACPAATVFRNYFVNGVGQARKQLDLLQQVGSILNNDTNKYWVMKNGYCLPASSDAMARLSLRLAADPQLTAKVRNRICVGIHWRTEVACMHVTADTNGSADDGSVGGGGSISSSCKQPASSSKFTSSSSSSSIRGGDRGGGGSGAKQMVCQVFSSALPVSYAKSTPSKDWAVFASLALDAAFDACIKAAQILSNSTSAPPTAPGSGSGSSEVRLRVFLTPLGGGAFGNRVDWITAAIGRSLVKHKDVAVDVKLVHYAGMVKSAFNNINEDFGIPRPSKTYKEEMKQFYSRVQTQTQTTAFSNPAVSIPSGRDGALLPRLPLSPEFVTNERSSIQQNCNEAKPFSLETFFSAAQDSLPLDHSSVTADDTDNASVCSVDSLGSYSSIGTKKKSRKSKSQRAYSRKPRGENSTVYVSKTALVGTSSLAKYKLAWSQLCSNRDSGVDAAATSITSTSSSPPSPSLSLPLPVPEKSVLRTKQLFLRPEVGGLSGVLRTESLSKSQSVGSGLDLSAKRPSSRLDPRTGSVTKAQSVSSGLVDLAAAKRPNSRLDAATPRCTSRSPVYTPSNSSSTSSSIVAGISSMPSPVKVNSQTSGYATGADSNVDRGLTLNWLRNIAMAKRSTESSSSLPILAQRPASPSLPDIDNTSKHIAIV